MLLAGVQTNTGAKTFNSGTLITGTINTPTASDLVINLGTQGGNGALIVFKLNNTEEMRFKMSGGLSIGVAADNTSRGVLMANGGTISTIAVNATQQAMLYSSSDDITIKSLSQNGTLTAIFGGSAKFSMLDSTFTERFAVSTVQLKTTGLYQDMGSIADPGNCGGSQGRTYWKLNGGGKMEFKAIGPSGAASVLFTEP
jgi:hypothetical protein